MNIHNFFSYINKLKYNSLQKFSKLLYHYGGYVYERPYKFIICSLLCSLILSGGFYFKKNEKDLYKLYALSNSYAYYTKTTINDFFYNSRKSFVIAESNFNILDEDILMELKKIEDNIRNMKIDLTYIEECNDNSVKKDNKSQLSKEVFELLDKKREHNIKALYDSFDVKNKDKKEIEYDHQNFDLYDEFTDDEDKEDGEEEEEEEEEEEDIYNNINENDDNKIFNKDNKQNLSISDFENDDFYPLTYIPPLLENADYCNLKNVFKDKNLDINLREVSNEIKKKITFTYEDICEKHLDECNIHSIFEYYEKDNAKIGDPIEVDTFPEYINYKSQKFILFKAILGNIVSKFKNYKTHIISANATLATISLLNMYTYEPYVLAFEKKLINYIKHYKIDEKLIENKKTIDNKKPYLKLYIFTERSIIDEVDRISRLDNLTLCLLLIGVFLIFLYTLLHNVTSVSYRSKPLCAIMGIICGFLGYLSGSGLLYYLGIKSVPPAETVPFLVIGVGVDDIFVILNSYSLLFMIKDDKKRIQICLKDSALAITVTTLTNIIAFLISSFSPFYSIYSFSLFVASSLLFCYIMVLTYFLSFLCIEAKLEKEKKSIFSYVSSIFFFNFLRRKKNNQISKEEPITMNDVSISVPNKDTSEKKYIDYENISIYEWIHNLYLFEESLNEKKKYTKCISNKKHCNNNDKNNIKENNESNENDENSYNIDSDNKNSDINQKNNKKKSKKKKSVCFKKKKKENNIDEKDNICDTNKTYDKTAKTNVDSKKENDTISVSNDFISSVEDEKDKDKCILSEYKENTNELNEEKINIEDENKIIKINDITKEIIETNKKGILKIKKISNIKHENTENVKNHTYNSSLELATKDTLNNILPESKNKNVYLLSSHDNVLFYKYIYKEPKGNIGKYFRSFIKNYYVPILSSKIGKIVIYIIFAFIIGIAAIGCRFMKKGIKYENAFPNDSYLREFNNVMFKYFSDYGDYIEVSYFNRHFIDKYRSLEPKNNLSFSSIYEKTKYNQQINNLNKNILWGKAHIHNEIYQMYKNFSELSFVSYQFNGFKQFLDHLDRNKDYNEKEFYNKLIYWLENSMEGKYFKNDFIILNEQLVAWRFYYYQKNTNNTITMGEWLEKCKKLAKIEKENIQMTCFHFSSIFIETDDAIIEVTIKNLLITIVAVLIVTAYIVKGFYSCIIITVIIFLIDLCIFGFICLCGITINIMSMVILILSVGFCIDHTSHIVQAYTHSIGRTRNEKMKESLHLMVSPVLHSGLSTWFIISTLFFSNKDFTIIFFQTLSLVLFFSIIFSSIFLPVLLSTVGPK